MMKKLLLLFTMILSVFTMNAQTGTLSAFSFSPDPVELGETINFSIDYTSDVDAFFEIALYKSQSSGTAVDWGTSVDWHSVDAPIAGTATTYNGSIDVTGITETSADIAPEVYLIMIQLKADSDSSTLAALEGYAVNANNTVEVITATGVINSIS